jgi:hypothetical protein
MIGNQSKLIGLYTLDGDTSGHSKVKYFIEKRYSMRTTARKERYVFESKGNYFIFDTLVG